MGLLGGGGGILLESQSNDDFEWFTGNNPFGAGCWGPTLSNSSNHPAPWGRQHAGCDGVCTLYCWASCVLCPVIVALIIIVSINSMSHLLFGCARYCALNTPQSIHVWVVLKTSPFGVIFFFRLKIGEEDLGENLSMNFNIFFNLVATVDSRWRILSGHERCHIHWSGSPAFQWGTAVFTHWNMDLCRHLWFLPSSPHKRICSDKLEKKG